jgi:UDP-N-acetylglucosamine--N-acetylmuramyl-(pentapeptide) pyrophosphoryl-undecaprenol N-acetylglucosamine transferase
LSQVKVPLSICHQVGKGHLRAMRQRYAEVKRPGASVIEFIEDMPAAIAAADLVISRAGAGAIAEICAIGRPSILVPLPRSGDHQLHNARGLETLGAASCLPQSVASADGLCLRINELVNDPERLKQMAERARAFGQPDAAERVARDLLVLAGLGHDQGATEVDATGSPAPSPVPGGDAP